MSVGGAAGLQDDATRALSLLLTKQQISLYLPYCCPPLRAEPEPVSDSGQRGHWMLLPRVGEEGNARRAVTRQGSDVHG